MVLETTDEKFDEVLKSDKLVVVDFWAEWCGPCRMMSSIVDELAEDFADKCVVGKVDCDANPEVCNKYGIRNIPTILFFKNGEIVDKQLGASPKQSMVDKITALL